MGRSARLCLVVLLLGCAEVGFVDSLDAAPTTGYGIALIGVDSDQPVGKLDVCSKRGCVDAGTFAGPDDLHALQLAPDEYCVTRLTGPAWGSAGVGVIELHEDRMCFEVREGHRGYVGHVVVEHASSETALTGVRIGLVDRSGAPSSPAQPPAPAPAPVDGALPAASGTGGLDAEQLRIGIDRVQTPVINCALEAGMDTGQTFVVEFTLDGPSGAAIETKVLAEGWPESLGACVRRVVSAQGPGLVPSSRVDQQRFQFTFSVR